MPQLPSLQVGGAPFPPGAGGGAPGGLPPEMMAGLLGGGGGPGGPPTDPTAQMGLAALDRLTTQEKSGELSLDRVKQALELAQKLIVASLPMVSQWNAKMAKELHVIGRQVADARINLTKESDVGPPPEAMMMGIQGTGLPGGF